jgi:hypothetical protein
MGKARRLTLKDMRYELHDALLGLHPAPYEEATQELKTAYWHDR